MFGRNSDGKLQTPCAAQGRSTLLGGGGDAMQKRKAEEGRVSPSYLFLELGDLASTFSPQHQSPWASSLWTQVPLLWDHGEMAEVPGEPVDLGEGLAINQCWSIC